MLDASLRLDLSIDARGSGSYNIRTTELGAEED